MNRAILTSLLASSLLSACAGDSLIPRDSERFTITSEPNGASVHIMGKQVGVTPFEVTKEQVFPLIYPKELEAKFGRIELRHPGCEPYEKPVSGHMLASGLKAKLQCDKPAPTPVAEPSVQERLRQLKSIFEEGLINKDEYEAKRHSILQDL